jgi:hypothetical protein
VLLLLLLLMCPAVAQNPGGRGCLTQHSCKQQPQAPAVQLQPCPSYGPAAVHPAAAPAARIVQQSQLPQLLPGAGRVMPLLRASTAAAAGLHWVPLKQYRMLLLLWVSPGPHMFRQRPTRPWA